MNILHGLTGSVATKVAGKFGDSYRELGYKSRVVSTFYADRFDAALWKFDERFIDSDEWLSYGDNGAVLHIELVKWADALVIAPLSANTLAKLANGLCDNLLTCVARAWDFNKPFVVAPACNTLMWEHPITQEHIDKISSWGIKIVPPIEKTLFCGDVGIGAMEDVEKIMNLLKKSLTTA